MFNNDDKKGLYRFITVVTVLFGLLTGGIIASQNNASASHVHHTRIKRSVRISKRTRRNRIQRLQTKALRRVKRAKQSRKVRKMVKHSVRRKGHGRKKMVKPHKETRPIKIERRLTSKDPVSVTPKNQD